LERGVLHEVEELRIVGKRPGGSGHRSVGDGGGAVRGLDAVAVGGTVLDGVVRKGRVEERLGGDSHKSPFGGVRPVNMNPASIRSSSPNECHRAPITSP
jgi:hypothetical protein